MRIRLTNTGSNEKMEEYYQKLLSKGWGANLSKETRTIKGITPSWDYEETTYELIIGSETESETFFDLSKDLGKELILTRIFDQPTIEIYDDWRE